MRNKSTNKRVAPKCTNACQMKGSGNFQLNARIN